ncbi:hypothetical protein PR202_gb29799 [Eleusine coracana subsp. coracana]|uniref:RNA-dependent RNA polymerase n=1 Tax=Eleusine coracana subsp. coracana TaxID=191504 RepID=A0AAV5G0L1_ELECO|nr:hypothetical protein PR202_gb29799 [Eleusine coracana subsp. coracana]
MCKFCIIINTTFVLFLPFSYVLGKAADCWLALMDRLLTLNVSESERHVIRKDILALVDIYYLALDAPKEGNKVSVPAKLMVSQYPHFMERPPNRSYNSTSVLGKIYDEVKLQESQTVSPISKLKTIIKISPLECFTEEVVAEEYKSRWKYLYQGYLKESSSLCKVGDKKIKNIKFWTLYQKYKRILYDAEEFEESQRSRPDLFEEACAIYQVVYELAILRDEVSKCGFAWKVAGRALCQLYALKRGVDTALCSFPVLEDAFKKYRA